MKSFNSIKLSLILLTFIVGCKTDEQKFADKQYDLFKRKIADDSLSVDAATEAEYLSQYHYELTKQQEALQWLDAYKSKMEAIHKKMKSESDSISKKVELLGGYKLIEIDSKTKCNLYKGYYQLNKRINDSADLAFLAKYLADKLFSSSSKKADCTNQLMSQVIIYQLGIKEKSRWASMCTISPSNYNGEVSVNKFELK